MAKGYWIARVDVENADRYPDYVATAKPAFEEFGATFLVRGGETHSLEGDNRARNVVIAFDSVETALACYNSEAYQAAKAIRLTSAQSELIIVEGVE